MGGKSAGLTGITVLAPVFISIALLIAGCNNLLHGYIYSQVISESSDPDSYLQLSPDSSLISKGSSTVITVSIASGSIGITDSQLTVTSGSGFLEKLSSDSWRFTASGEFGGTVTVNGIVNGEYNLSLSRSVSIEVEKSWELIGSPYFTPSNAVKPVISTDPDGVPYVAFATSAGLTGPISVMKFTGSGDSGWESVGSSGFSAGNVDYINLRFNTNGIPFAAFKDSGNEDKAVVMQYTGGGSTGWESLGNTPVSAGEANYINLWLDHTGTPFLAYEDGTDSYKPKMWKYTSDTWNELAGSIGGGGKDWITICVDPDTSRIGVAYQNWEDNDRIIAKWYSDFGAIKSWNNLGNTGFSTGAAKYNILRYFDGFSYVFFSDDNGIHLYRLETDTWIGIAPTVNFSTTPAANVPVFEISPDGKPFIAVNDYDNGSGKCDPKVGFLENGSWKFLPTGIGDEMDFFFSGFSGTLDNQGRPLIVYGEQANKKLSVLRYQ